MKLTLDITAAQACLLHGLGYHLVQSPAEVMRMLATHPGLELLMAKPVIDVGKILVKAIEEQGLENG